MATGGMLISHAQRLFARKGSAFEGASRRLRLVGQ
jgi:hypothetical protein